METNLNERHEAILPQERHQKHHTQCNLDQKKYRNHQCHYVVKNKKSIKA